MIPEVHLEKRLDRICSYILRAGRTTAEQRRVIHDLGPHFLLTFQEISFGMGEIAAKIVVGSLNQSPLHNLRFLIERAMGSRRSWQCRLMVVERLIGVQSRKRFQWTC
jgi:hypothetical protein